uniref:ROK family transcriptional regulator n=1 Tax=Staphylococcus sp. LKG8-2 TaxID=3399689 RepID=UPI003BF5291C
MDINTFNQQSIKQFNTNKILKILRNNITISRSDIAKNSNLNKATVSTIIRDLIKEGLVFDLGPGDSNGGRKPHLLKFNPNKKYVIGIDIGVNNIQCIVMNLAFDEIWSKQIYPADHQLTSITIEIDNLLKSFFKSTDIKYSDIIKIGIAVPGTVSQKGEIIHAPNLNWKNIILENELSDIANQLPIEVYNEANAGALGERINYKNSNIEHLVYVSVGIGIGTGIIINSELYEGSYGLAGEFGHNVIKDGGRICHCGRKGCWQMYASEQSIYDEVEKRGITLKEKNIANILLLLENKNPEMLSLIRDISSHIIVGIKNIIRAINPELIIIGDKIKYLKTYLEIPQYIENTEIVFSNEDRSSTILGMVSVINERYLTNDRYLKDH